LAANPGVACLRTIAGIAIVAHQRRTGLAHAARVAGLVAVARVAIATRTASWNRVVLTTTYGIARVGGARIRVVTVQRYSGQADPGAVAGLIAVADVAVITDGRFAVQTTQGHIASLETVAGIAVVADKRIAQLAAVKRIAGLIAGASVAVIALQRRTEHASIVDARL
jgi:hypothetical protein